SVFDQHAPGEPRVSGNDQLRGPDLQIERSLRVLADHLANGFREIAARLEDAKNEEWQVTEYRTWLRTAWNGPIGFHLGKSSSDVYGGYTDGMKNGCNIPPPTR